MTPAPTRDLQSMQRQAADCLANYAEANRLDHAGLDALIAHLRAYPDAGEAMALPSWDQAGSELQIAGRGDPLPPSLLGQIAADKHEELNDLICSCVEVGIADLYGATTGVPDQMLARALAILQRNAPQKT
ncbi:hypothetical protein [Stenotrophomonas maltophilia]|uniref:hypothetical protein n=1 Tax=Stenotrophomonas maltophilia TaxID=40324 RepID=UPI00083FCC0B|nr:hypothetical protein [Stenotrophomonas maltophilia]MBY6280951.1 hypothetical protein [Stenotrophomonas maltophilia]